MRKKLTAAIIFLLAGLTLQAQEAVYQKSVLALYKSSENQDSKENEIFFYMSRILDEMGLNVVYWDIDRGIPGDSVTRYCRAVISWFRGPSMRNPEEYLDFMDRMIESGKKYIVVDNFGAYQNRQTEEYIQPLRLNSTLAKLGIMYYGDWSQEQNLLQLVYKDSSMVEDQAKQDVSFSSFFYRFIPSDRELKTWLSIKRTDRDYDPSPVIVTNRNGGFALSRYIYRVENNQVKLLLNMKKFLTESLFPPSESQKVAILVNPSVDEAEKILNFTEEVFQRSKIDYRIITSASFRGMVPDDLLPFSSVGLILNADTGLEPEILENYLNKGGNVVSLLSGRFNKLSPLLAISEVKPTPRKATGYKIEDRFLTGESTAINDNLLEWQPGGAVPADSAKILGSSFNGRNALLWTQKVGGGKVLVWNWDEFVYGEFMGMILESFLYVQPVGVAATPALSIMYLDDWPLPMYNIYREQLNGQLDTDFYTDTWWTDITGLMDKWKQPFSTFLIFNYNAATKPPFETGEFFVAKNNGSMRMVKDQFSRGIELGLHGYNHMSLTEKKSEANAFTWDSPANMELAVRQAREDWERLFGRENLPLSYVAPHNIISQEGIAVLHKYFPSITSVSTIYYGENPEEAYEFGYNKEIPHIYMMPRISSGYHLDQGVRKDIISGIIGPGVFSHFIHADDVFDPARSLGDDWKTLLTGLDEIFSYVRANYPWLTPVNSFGAYRAMTDYDSRMADFVIDGDDVTVRTNREGLIFRVRTDGRKIASVTGGTVLYQYKAVDEAVIRADERNVFIRLR